MQKYNSTILIKKKQLKCGCFDFNFSKDRCKFHATVEDLEKRLKKHDELIVSSSLLKLVDNTNSELNRWFNDRRKEMTGFCKNCGGKSCMNDDKYFKFSIAHILPKAYFPSVATHSDNWLELCFWQKSCHNNFDNKVLDLTEMNCWNEIVIKFQKIYPFIAANEKRRIPETLLQYLNTDF